MPLVGWVPGLIVNEDSFDKFKIVYIYYMFAVFFKCLKMWCLFFRDNFPIGNKMPATNIPVSGAGPVAR